MLAYKFRTIGALKSEGANLIVRYFEAGRMRPAARRLPTSAVNEQNLNAPETFILAYFNISQIKASRSHYYLLYITIC